VALRKKSEPLNPRICRRARAESLSFCGRLRHCGLNSKERWRLGWANDIFF
jgi:hypothetical protein